MATIFRSGQFKKNIYLLSVIIPSKIQFRGGVTELLILHLS